MMRSISFLVIFMTSAGAASAAPGGGGRGSFSTPGPARGISPPAFVPPTDVRQSAFPLNSRSRSRIFNRGLPSYGYGYFGGFVPYWYDESYGYSSNGVIDYNITNYNFLPPPYDPPRNFAVPDALPNDHPSTARLTLQIPAVADLTINGKKIDAGTNFRFESPELRPEESFTFDVRVAWRENGKIIEEKRTLTMRPGDHQNLMYLAAPSASPAMIERIEK